MAADGPRVGRPDDQQLCRQTREIFQRVDWDCEVKTLFREENLGCKRAVSQAITWFLDAVGEGIILEDDCVPNTSFFHFTSALLKKYRDHEQVMMISGTNYFPKPSMKSDYFFSHFCPIWGWATWKSSWQTLDLEMKEFTSLRDGKHFRRSIGHRLFATKMIDMMQYQIEQKGDSWAIPWYYSIRSHDGLCAVPKFNLVENVGLSGTHANNDTRFKKMPSTEFESQKFKDPASVNCDMNMDRQIYDRIIQEEKAKLQLIKLWIIQAAKRMLA